MIPSNSSQYNDNNISDSTPVYVVSIQQTTKKDLNVCLFLIK